VQLLKPDTRDTLDRRLAAYQQRTGHQVIVWIGDTIGNEVLETWAARTFAAWGIGRKGKDDGVAIFLLARDRKVRIEVGYGVEGQLPDLTTARIIQERIVPWLRQGNADAALTGAVDGVLATLGGEAPGAAPGSDPTARRHLSPIELLVMGVVGLLLLLFVISHPALAVSLLYSLTAGGRGGGHWGGGGGFSGGGFSGGGGRSGGGGASGSW
jgi:uncharacterized protein